MGSTESYYSCLEQISKQHVQRRLWGNIGETSFYVSQTHLHKWLRTWEPTPEELEFQLYP